MYTDFTREQVLAAMSEYFRAAADCDPRSLRDHTYSVDRLLEERLRLAQHSKAPASGPLGAQFQHRQLDALDRARQEARERMQREMAECKAEEERLEAEARRLRQLESSDAERRAVKASRARSLRTATPSLPPLQTTASVGMPAFPVRKEHPLDRLHQQAAEALAEAQLVAYRPEYPPSLDELEEEPMLKWY